ncbi:putative transposase, partial [Staphylococcus simiae CCM 7213 = CCUG 51256]
MTDFVAWRKSIDLKRTYGYLPEYIVADAGYGSEQNYMAIIDDFNRTP